MATGIQDTLLDFRFSEDPFTVRFVNNVIAANNQLDDWNTTAYSTILFTGSGSLNVTIEFKNPCENNTITSITASGNNFNSFIDDLKNKVNFVPSLLTYFSVYSNVTNTLIIALNPNIECVKNLSLQKINDSSIITLNSGSYTLNKNNFVSVPTDSNRTNPSFSSVDLNLYELAIFNDNTLSPDRKPIDFINNSSTPIPIIYGNTAKNDNLIAELTQDRGQVADFKFEISKLVDSRFDWPTINDYRNKYTEPKAFYYILKPTGLENGYFSTIKYVTKGKMPYNSIKNTTLDYTYLNGSLFFGDFYDLLQPIHYKYSDVLQFPNVEIPSIFKEDKNQLEIPITFKNGSYWVKEGYDNNYNDDLIVKATATFSDNSTYSITADTINYTDLYDRFAGNLTYNASYQPIKDEIETYEVLNDVTLKSVKWTATVDNNGDPQSVVTPINIEYIEPDCNTEAKVELLWLNQTGGWEASTFENLYQKEYNVEFETFLIDYYSSLDTEQTFNKQDRMNDKIINERNFIITIRKKISKYEYNQMLGLISSSRVWINLSGNFLPLTILTDSIEFDDEQDTNVIEIQYKYDI